jgi:hypothetical protein
VNNCGDNGDKSDGDDDIVLKIDIYILIIIRIYVFMDTYINAYIRVHRNIKNSLMDSFDEDQYGQLPTSPRTRQRGRNLDPKRLDTLLQKVC